MHERVGKTSIRIAQSCSRRSVVVGSAALAVVGASDNKSLTSSPLYSGAFTQPGHKWFSVQARQVDHTDPEYQELPILEKDGELFARLSGRYWHDHNHKTDGVSVLNLLACTFTRSTQSWRTGIFEGSISSGPHNLLNRNFNVRCRANELKLPRNTRIGLWIQIFDPSGASGAGRFTNIFQTKNILCEQLGFSRPLLRPSLQEHISTNWVNCTIPISDSSNHWVCLAPSELKKNIYNCSSDIIYLLKQWDYNLGLIAVHDNVADSNIEGTIDVSSISIST